MMALTNISNKKVFLNEELFYETLDVSVDQIPNANDSSTLKGNCEVVLSHKFEKFYGRRINGKVLRFAANSFVGSIMEKVEKDEPFIVYPFLFSLVQGKARDVYADKKALIVDQANIDPEDYKTFRKLQGYHEEKNRQLELKTLTKEIDLMIREILVKNVTN